jgi:hypothetical protein
MLFKRIARNDAEKIFIVVQNVSGSTMTAGYHVVYDVSTDGDGVRVTQASTFDLQAYAGCVDADIADDAFGLVQVYGYRDAGYVGHSGVANSGDNLGPDAGQWALEQTPIAAATGYKAFAFICQTITSVTESTYANKNIFIRAL